MQTTLTSCVCDSEMRIRISTILEQSMLTIFNALIRYLCLFDSLSIPIFYLSKTGFAAQLYSYHHIISAWLLLQKKRLKISDSSCHPIGWFNNSFLRFIALLLTLISENSHNLFHSMWILIENVTDISDLVICAPCCKTYSTNKWEEHENWIRRNSTSEQYFGFQKSCEPFIFCLSNSVIFIQTAYSSNNLPFLRPLFQNTLLTIWCFLYHISIPTTSLKVFPLYGSNTLLNSIAFAFSKNSSSSMYSFTSIIAIF